VKWIWLTSKAGRADASHDKIVFLQGPQVIKTFILPVNF